MNENLEKLQAAARRKLAEADETPARQAQRRRRISSFRLGMWLLEAMVFLFVVAHFVIRPMLLRRESGRADSGVAVQALKPAPVLGPASVDIPGAAEVVNAYLPAVNLLAPGARVAQEAQLMVSKERRLPVEIQNSIGMRFRLIPNGSFVMGSPAQEAGRWAGEVQHVKQVPRPFYIGSHEVTQAEWKAIMGTNPADFKGAARPVEEITWYDCQKFILALCEKEDLPRWTYRLPTEAEWEFACRAGAETAYHFGNEARRLAEFDNYAGSGWRQPRAVGQLRQNAYGLYDMHGNVWEWCLDVYRDYPGSPVSAAEDDGVWRVIRGGNWYVEADDCRSATRSRLTPTSHGNMLGFRLVRQIPTAPEEINAGE